MKLTKPKESELSLDFMNHVFLGKWITDQEFFELKPRNVFHRQLESIDLPCEEHRNRHILFRKKFFCDGVTDRAHIYISADDYYKLYVNGQFVAQGPAPSYHSNYNYNEIDVASYLKPGENLIAVHTLYQGLINRVWQSGDNRHGLILDLVIDGNTVVVSDESFKTAVHSAYTEMGTSGYDTQFLERYDSGAAEVDFADCHFDDTDWSQAKVHLYADHALTLQKTGMLEFERVMPVELSHTQNHVVYDFGSNYVGYLCAKACGKKGDILTVRCAQELNDDGTLRYNLRANCTYEEEWLLNDGESILDWFDYKSFRYAEFYLPDGAEVFDVSLCARHYPFSLNTKIKPEFAQNREIKRIWDLCVHTQKYGVQEVIQDCMDREKGFYLGDGCYTALTNMILTHDDSMVRKLIDDAFYSSFITDTLVTCMDCSFMQEIAEYPFILVYLVLWHYNFTGDKDYLKQNYMQIQKVLDAYRREYETGYLLRNLDKWCVVEWPKNFQHGYDVSIFEGLVCEQAHVSLNSYYIAAIRTANRIAEILGLPVYREEAPHISAFMDAFYSKEKKLFKDGENTDHISLVGNSFAYGLGICSNEEFEREFLALYHEHGGMAALSFFCTFPLLTRFVQRERFDLVEQALLHEGTWKRMLREGSTTTFEGWGKDTKWNISLFHLTYTYAATFIADVDLKQLFGVA